jgi:hypothetical protein
MKTRGKERYSYAAHTTLVFVNHSILQKQQITWLLNGTLILIFMNVS